MDKAFTIQSDLSIIIETAFAEGEARIQREDGQTFIIQPERARGSFLDVPGIDLKINTDEIIDSIHARRDM